MATSGGWEVGNSGRGQSAVGLSRLALREPAWPWARAPASGFGSAGPKGRSCVGGRRTERRRIAKRGVVWGRTGDMAHLYAIPLFRFLFAMSRKFLSRTSRTFKCLALCIENTASPFSSPVRSASWYSIFLGFSGEPSACAHRVSLAFYFSAAYCSSRVSLPPKIPGKSLPFPRILFRRYGRHQVHRQSRVAALADRNP